MTLPHHCVIGRAREEDIYAHLLRCDGQFVPPLSGRVDIAAYANKIATRATTYEVWDNGALIGLVAAYNDAVTQRPAFITSVSVDDFWQGKGIATLMLRQCLRHLRELGFARCNLEVHDSNLGANALYRKIGFCVTGQQGTVQTLSLIL